MAWIEKRPAGYFVAWRDPVTHAIQREWFRKGQYDLARERKTDIERELRRDQHVPLALRRTALEVYIARLIEADTELRQGSRDCR